MMTPRTVGISATLALVLLGTAACGGDSDDSNDTDAGGSASEEAGAEGDGETVEIQYLHRLPDGEGMIKVADLVAEWNADNPGVQVTATKFDGAGPEMIKKIETDVRAGNAPCLAQLGYSEVPAAFTNGLVEDVTAQAADYETNFSGGSFGLMKVGDITVGLPQDTGPLVYYYNKTAFEDLGIDVPATGEEFIVAASAAAAEGQYIADFQPDEATHWLAGQAAAAGATWYSVENDAWKVTVDGPETQLVADFWQQLLDDNSVLTHNRWDDTFSKALVDQELIGTIGPAWDAPLLADAMEGSDNEGQWAVTQIPQLGAEAMSGPDGGSGVAVLKGCEHPDEAMEFNNWFNTQVDGLVSQGLVVATTVAPMTTPEALSEFYGGQDVFAELSAANEATNPSFPYMPTFPAVSDPMVTAAAAAASGSGQVADIFAAAQEASVSSLTDAGLPVAK